MNAATEPGPCTEHERAVLNNVAADLAKGAALRRWFMDSGQFDQRFDMTCTDRDSESSVGFFGVANLPGGVRMPVMGNAQQMFFDRSRAGPEGAVEFARQLREFVFRYFLRVASFQQPEAVDKRSRADADRGFGYTQHFACCKNGRVVRFHEPHRILDLREIGPCYDWVTARVRFHDFNINVRPTGASGPALIFQLAPENDVVLAPEFIIQRERPEPGVLAEYGFAYAAIHDSNPGLLAYGPGAFEAAVQLFHWRVYESGTVLARMAFVSNRPRQVARIPIDPVHWALRAADVASRRVLTKYMKQLRRGWDRRVHPPMFDPVYATIDGLNRLTAGKAARDWRISREQIEKNLLMLHFRQHYRAISGALRTWRQIPDWTDESAMPQWALDGKVEQCQHRFRAMPGNS